MYIDAIGLIFADDKMINLGELTKPRALAAIPFGGRYRIIDFILSNLVNSGITSIGVATFNKYKSLLDHLGTGSDWDLDRKNQGLHIIAPFANSETHHGTNDILGILDFLRYRKRKYVLICGSSCVFNMDFQSLLETHIQSYADMTVLYSKETGKLKNPETVLEFDRKNVLKGWRLDPEDDVKARKSFLGVAIVERELLVKILSDLKSRGKSEIDMSTLLNLYEKYTVRGVEYKGLCLRIHSVSSYFKESMRSLSEEAQKELYWKEKPIYTKVKDEAPSYYSDTACVHDCMISDGCEVEGEIYQSLLFRGVSVGKGSVVRNCILFQNVNIGENCVLENCILDKNVHIRPGTKLVGETEYPVVIEKNAII